MDSKFNYPKSFGKILDHTFSLSKNKFVDFFTLFLIFVGPIYLLQAFFQLIAGVGFFREMGDGELWFERTLMSFQETNLLADLGIILVSFVSFFLYPFAAGSILFAVNHIRKNEEYTISQVIKEAASRYGYLLASSFLFGLMAFGIFFVPMIFIIIIGTFATLANPVLGIIIILLFFLGLFVGGGYFLTRWSFYFAIVAVEGDALGFSQSWRLTKNRAWILFGLYVVFFLIISIITNTVEISLSLVLGNSVFLTLLIGVLAMFTTMIFTVGYAIMYFDLKLRYDAEDLKEMLQDYNTGHMGTR